MSCKAMGGPLSFFTTPVLIGFGILAAAGAVVYSCGPNIVVGAVKVPYHALAARTNRAALDQLNEQINMAQEPPEKDRLIGIQRELEKNRS